LLIVRQFEVAQKGVKLGVKKGGKNRPKIGALLGYCNGLAKRGVRVLTLVKK